MLRDLVGDVGLAGVVRGRSERDGRSSNDNRVRTIRNLSMPVLDDARAQRLGRQLGAPARAEPAHEAANAICSLLGAAVLAADLGIRGAARDQPQDGKVGVVQTVAPEGVRCRVGFGVAGLEAIGCSAASPKSSDTRSRKARAMRSRSARTARSITSGSIDSRCARAAASSLTVRLFPPRPRRGTSRSAAPRCPSPGARSGAPPDASTPPGWPRSDRAPR